MCMRFNDIQQDKKLPLNSYYFLTGKINSNYSYFFLPSENNKILIEDEKTCSAKLKSEKHILI